MKKISYGVVIMLCFLFSLSCNTGGADSEVSPAPAIKVGNSMYLEEVIPPCIDSVSSGIDPCVPEVPPEVEILSSSSSSAWPQDNFPTWTEIMLADEYFSSATHIIIRGVVNVNTTRCEAYPVKVANYFNDMFSDRFIDFLETGSFENGDLDYHCFVDINVKEYIVGTGPPKLTVSVHQETIWDTSINDWPNVKDMWESLLDDPQLRTASAYEGKELLLFLGTTFTTSLESWEVQGLYTGIWFVQQTGNEVRAVAQNYRYARTEAQRSRLDLPLDELVEQIKKAAEERLVVTEGRIGTELYFPLLVTDANYLKDYYTSVGAVYDASEGSTVLPPLTPGEGDPAAPTIPVNEGTTDTTLPVPGEETSVPPSSDDAGLTVGQETTTTTSTTTVAEVPVTTGITPTVTTAAPVEEPVATVPDATETVTGTTTTTTTTAVVETESNGEDVAPSADDDSSGGEPAASTSVSSTLAQTTAVVAPSGGDDGSVEGPDTTVPSDGVAPPVDNGGPEEEEQPDTGPPVDDG